MVFKGNDTKLNFCRYCRHLSGMLMMYVQTVYFLYTFCILNSHKQAVSPGKMNYLFTV